MTGNVRRRTRIGRAMGSQVRGKVRGASGANEAGEMRYPFPKEDRVGSHTVAALMGEC